MYSLIPRPARILLVEDNHGDVFLAEKALKKSEILHTLDVCTTGEEAMEHLRSRPRPDIILLDLNLPTMSGSEVLFEIKTNPLLKIIPVVVLTSSTADTDVIQSYSIGANGYMVKPTDQKSFSKLACVFKSFWFDVGRTPPNP